MIFCAYSPFFKDLLEQNPAKHPIIILKDVLFHHLPDCHPGVHVRFLSSSRLQSLKVKGLAEAPV